MDTRPGASEVGPARLELEGKLIRARFERAKETPIIGNAYNDHDLLNSLPEMALDAASAANDPTLSFEILDYLGQQVMGLDPMPWQSQDKTKLDGFVEHWTWAHQEGMLDRDELWDPTDAE